MNTKTNVSPQRDYLFDNIRALLILLVVIGHMISSQVNKITVAEILYYFIYLFHMPAFIFITGYFSKNMDKARDNAVRTYLIPYLVINSLYTVLGSISLYKPTSSFRFFLPVWGFWFLLAVFIWKLLLKDIARIRYILPLSFVIGLLSGFTKEFTSEFSLARVINFLPFFLLGFFCTKEHVDIIRRIPKWITMITLMAFGGLSYILAEYNLMKMDAFYLKRAYSSNMESAMLEIYSRIFIYVSAIIIIICLINLFSSKQTWYSKVGQNSLTVYILHLFVVSNIKSIKLPWDGTPYFVVYSIIISIIISYVFSRDIVLNAYKTIMGFINKLIFKTQD